MNSVWGRRNRVDISGCWNMGTSWELHKPQTRPQTGRNIQSRNDNFFFFWSDFTLTYRKQQNQSLQLNSGLSYHIRLLLLDSVPVMPLLLVGDPTAPTPPRVVLSRGQTAGDEFSTTDSASPRQTGALGTFSKIQKLRKRDSFTSSNPSAPFLLTHRSSLILFETNIHHSLQTSPWVWGCRSKSFQNCRPGGTCGVWGADGRDEALQTRI